MCKKALLGVHVGREIWYRWCMYIHMSNEGTQYAAKATMCICTEFQAFIYTHFHVCVSMPQSRRIFALSFNHSFCRQLPLNSFDFVNLGHDYIYDGNTHGSNDVHAPTCRFFMNCLHTYIQYYIYIYYICVRIWTDSGMLGALPIEQSTYRHGANKCH